MRRFLECLIPLTSCNLCCSYCYVIQEGRRKNEGAGFLYSPQHIGQALSQKRLGGVSLISMTASGETFIAKELSEISAEILKQGHFINITTNGTLTKRIEHFLQATDDYHDHIHISFSLHYVELLKNNLVDVFFDNVCRVKSSGCSILLQINLSDEYLPYWEEIKRISLERVGAYPQVALTRLEKNGQYDIISKQLTAEEYFQKGEEMDSPLFRYTYKNFNVKRKEYCYAGYWSAKLNLATGEMTGCYGLGVHQNIFEDLSRPIKWRPIGHHCNHRYCINSSHFMSQGIIPDLMPQPSYGELRNREEAGWYSSVMKDFLYRQFEDTNRCLSPIEKWWYEFVNSHPNLKGRIKARIADFYALLKKPF